MFAVEVALCDLPPRKRTQTEMSETTRVKVKDLSLDLANFRTVRQAAEPSAIEAMIATSPDRFWALADSLIDDGYLPTDTIIVLSDGKSRPMLTVREGNRRVAVLKLILGYITIQKHFLSTEFVSRSKSVSAEWREDNATVPCTIYQPVDAAVVDRIVTLAHGKGEKAGRDQWNAVARARHSRDVGKASEPALDLLEKYLPIARNVTDDQKARWAGLFPVTILEEAMKRLAPRLNADSAPDLAAKYPDAGVRGVLDTVIRDVGLEQLRFETIRSKELDFALKYGLPPLEPSKPSSPKGGPDTPPQRNPKPDQPKPDKPERPRAEKAIATTDPRAVRKCLRQFTPRGKERGKVVDLKTEAARINIDETPLAFCFVLRSMFEISAKAYCTDHASEGLSTTKPDGNERYLVDVLRSIVDHATRGKVDSTGKIKKDKEKEKLLHGAMTELAKKDGLLSVTSMNQLVHNPRFSVAPADIARSFFNMYPLLDEMNS